MSSLPKQRNLQDIISDLETIPAIRYTRNEITELYRQFLRANPQLETRLPIKENRGDIIANLTCKGRYGTEPTHEYFSPLFLLNELFSERAKKSPTYVEEDYRSTTFTIKSLCLLLEPTEFEKKDSARGYFTPKKLLILEFLKKQWSETAFEQVHDLAREAKHRIESIEQRRAELKAEQELPSLFHARA